MALVINGTNIPASGKVVCNGTSLKQLNIGGTKVWNSGIDLIAANNWTKLPRRMASGAVPLHSYGCAPNGVQTGGTGLSCAARR